MPSGKSACVAAPSSTSTFSPSHSRSQSPSNFRNWARARFVEHEFDHLHGAEIRCVSLQAGLVATASEDNTLRLWSLEKLCEAKKTPADRKRAVPAAGSASATDSKAQEP